MAVTTERPPEARDREDGSVAPPRATRLRATFKIGAKATTWAFFMMWVVLASIVLAWVGLTAFKLQSRPQGKAFVVLAVVLAFAGGMYLAVTRFVASRRTVARIVALAVAVVFFASAVWVRSSPDRALFLARDLAWGDSDVYDYEKFPARPIAAPSTAFTFAKRSIPEALQTITYKAGGETKNLPIAEFLEDTNTTSFIVLKDGQLLYEGYANGYERNSIVTSFSIAKSVTSALVGIAMDEGFIGSVNDPIVDYLPEMRGRGFDEMTIRDVLLMSTGIIFNPQDDKSSFGELWPFHDEALSYYYPNLRDLALHLPASRQPVGAAFNYNQYHPLLLGLILERTTHRTVSQYLEEKLWQPLGAEFPASWSLDSTRYGFEKMESGINGRAIDFAKFGQLFLDNGLWNGQQLVSSSWVTDSTAPGTDDHRPFLSSQYCQEAGGYYRYMWWGKPTPDGRGYYNALGHLGQRIAVFPDRGVVIVRFGINEGGVDWDAVIESIEASLR